MRGRVFKLMVGLFLVLCIFCVLSCFMKVSFIFVLAQSDGEFVTIFNDLGGTFVMKV